ncbi:MAG: hypothetical protein AB7G75_25175 [Candidatus Binatia bacterium]
MPDTALLCGNGGYKPSTVMIVAIHGRPDIVSRCDMFTAPGCCRRKEQLLDKA